MLDFVIWVQGLALGALVIISLLIFGVFTDVSQKECEASTQTTCSIQWVPDHE